MDRQHSSVDRCVFHPSICSAQLTEFESPMQYDSPGRTSV